MIQDTHPFFVYGTLKEGHSNHRLIESFIVQKCQAKLSGFAMYSFGLYPMVFQSEGGEVFGEVYWVETHRYDEALAQLDWLEGHPTLYRRELRAVWLLDEEQAVRAWVYVAPPGSLPDDLALVRGGIWLQRKG